MSHAPWSAWIDDLVTGELADARRAELEAHLGTCEACRAELEALRSMRAAARALSGRAPVPAALQMRVRRSLAAAAPAPRRALAVWLGVAATLAVAFGGLWLARPLPPGPPVGAAAPPALAAWPAAAFADYRSLRVRRLPLDLATSDKAAVERHLAGRVPFRPRVIDLRMMGYTIEGGGLRSILGREGTLVAYRGREGRLVLCLMLAGRVEDLPPPADTRDHRGFSFRTYREGDLTAVIWQERDILCALVSDAPSESVLALAFEKAIA